MTRTIATEVVQRLVEAGHQAVFAGGCVRDQIMGVTPHDYDIATSATPNQIEELFEDTIPVGRQFGIVVVRHKECNFEVATFRSDGVYTDGRRPVGVSFDSIEQDACRRDFTINALFEDPLTGEILDFVGGVHDIRIGRLRTVGNPHDRFEEDALRLIRAIRFATRFNLEFEKETLVAICALSQNIHYVSYERIGEELAKTLVGPNLDRAIQLLSVTGLLKAVAPEVKCIEPLNLSNALSKRIANNEALAFAILFRGVSSDIVRIQLKRLRRPTFIINRVVQLLDEVKKVPACCDMDLASLKRFIRQPYIDDILTYDSICGEMTLEGLMGSERCIISRVLYSPEDLNPTPLLNGDDLWKMGLTPGPLFHVILKNLETAQLNGDVQTREQAETLARNTTLS